MSVTERARRLFESIVPPARQMSTWEGYSEDAAKLADVIDATSAVLERQQQHPERVKTAREMRTCNWFIPPFENPYYGGIMTILRFAEYMQRVGGISQRFVVCGNAAPETIAAKIAVAFPGLSSAPVYTLDTVGAIHAIPAADYGFATLWTTAYVLLGVENCGLKFYFVQDYEPLFYPAGSTYAQAEITYRFGFHCICNTPGVRRAVEAVSRGRAIHFVPRVNHDVFFHADDRFRPNHPKRVFYYGRPGHPRNAFELGLAALHRLKAMMGDGVDIVSAGSVWPGNYQGFEGIVTQRGVLPYEETANLYRTCHAGLVLMMTKHPSYLPFELMACGSVVVTNTNDANTWFLRDGENCLLAPATATGIAETVRRALDNWHQLGGLRSNALRSVKPIKASTWDTEFVSIIEFIEACTHEI